MCRQSSSAISGILVLRQVTKPPALCFIELADGDDDRESGHKVYVCYKMRWKDLEPGCGRVCFRSNAPVLSQLLRVPDKATSKLNDEQRYVDVKVGKLQRCGSGFAGTTPQRSSVERPPAGSRCQGLSDDSQDHPPKSPPPQQPC